MPSVEEPEDAPRQPKMTVGRLQRKIKTDVKEIVADPGMSKEIVRNVDELINKKLQDKSKLRRSGETGPRNGKPRAPFTGNFPLSPTPVPTDLAMQSRQYELMNPRGNFGNLIERNKRQLNHYNPGVRELM